MQLIWMDTTIFYKKTLISLLVNLKYSEVIWNRNSNKNSTSNSRKWINRRGL